ncbi:hypothetical protein DPMN_118061 [Dreissena polymorpha]|uniref:Uncharacterized protein n=2 Tax=Dreissena polymorpha TaxID=45954 RepID=A0A9D4JN59_DREPO|nr:hypothetical protein DPMN_118061 [Dreissena polymorpha]
MQLLAEYKAKLNIDGEIIEDPMTVSKGWLSEKVGMSKWPSLYIGDISEYLHTNQPKDLIRRVVNEYKEGKAIATSQANGLRKCFTMTSVKVLTNVCLSHRLHHHRL